MKAVGWLVRPVPDKPRRLRTEMIPATLKLYIIGISHWLSLEDLDE
jgi:hypothetical protein